VEEITALYAITEMINRSNDLDQVLRLALDSATDLAGMESGGILLFDPSTNEMFLGAHRGWSPEFIQAVSEAKADEGLMPHMLESALVLDDLSKLSTKRRVAAEKEGFRSMVSIPIKAKESALGVIGLESRSPHTFSHETLELLVAIGSQVGVAVDRANLQTQELRAAILEERQEMARQMHDDIAQTLGYLGLQLDSVMDNSSLVQNAEVQAELEGLRKIVENAYGGIRKSIARLQEDVPSHFDLGIALSEIINAFEKQTRCNVESKVDRDLLLSLSASVALQANYIIREALANVVKHSDADSVCLTIQGLEDGMIEIIIQDDGSGFDFGGRRSGWPGFGLRFMRERAERVGGTLSIESEPDQGTRVAARLPAGQEGG
jgi:two-component system nitrate/nitrite sensor histidine kinase NarX